MTITLEIPEDFFEEDEKKKLMSLFDVDNQDQFLESINRVVLAALHEYRDMFLGMGLPSRANEIREFRLYYLIKRYFKSRIPDEYEVSAMFQLPETRSKNLILNVLTRFRYELEEEIFNTLSVMIKDAEEINDGQEYRLYINSANMVDELDKIIRSENFRFKRLSKVRGEAAQYIIAPDSYKAICKYLGIECK